MCHTHGHRPFFAAGRRWDFDPASMAAFWWGGAGGRHRGRSRRGGRVFEQGDLKLVILQLLDEKPRHGYDIIKELEERFGGTYSPSPGTVYPTLAMLEDLGYAVPRPDDGGRRIYELTPEGKRHLEEQRDQVTDIFDRIAEMGTNLFSTGMLELSQAFKRVGWATFSNAPKLSGSAEKMQRVREILERAAKDIEDAVR